MKRNRLIWIDLEMTGLNPLTDKILEIATIVTDDELEVIAEGPNLVIHEPASVLEAMDPWCRKVHKKTDLWEQSITTDRTAEQAEAETLAFLEEHCEAKTSLLCGNSVWMDRVFMMHYMPKLYAFLHYRTIDTSTIKELAKRWYPSRHSEFKKSNSHRALDDIRESIEELKYYREHFFL